MTDMTPEQARHVLHDNITPPEPGSMTYYAQSFRALTALAADTIEYGVEYTGVNHGHRHTGSNASWHAKRKHAEREYRQMARSGMKPRLVARRVSAPWEVKE